MMKMPFMLSCHDTTALMSKGRDEQLTRRERATMRLHASMCSACSNFEDQLIVLGDTARSYAQDEGGHGSEDAQPA